MKDSKFQKAIYAEVENGKEHLVISAVAGSGKTTTIINCLPRIPKEKSKIFVAFNNAIVDELKKKINNPEVVITTMHSICWRALMKHYNYKVKLNNAKPLKIIERQAKLLKILPKRIGFIMYTVSKLVDLIRHNLIDISDLDIVAALAERYDLDFDDEIYTIAKNTLTLMNKNRKEFDFTDMIFRIIEDDVTMPRFDFVFVDESQDLSKLQHQIIKKLVARKGRMIAVGDPRQAIYGFAGADANSYNNLRNLFKGTVELPLSVNYRCGTDIVEHAKEINPVILSFKKNPKGLVKDSPCKAISDGDWVLCRNVKPLIVMNLYFLIKGQKSYVRGKDIGKGLEVFIKKMNCNSISSLLKKIDLTVGVEMNKMRAKGIRNPQNTGKIDRMVQRTDAIKILSKNVNSVSVLVQFIRSVFKDEGEGVCLSTIHKSKGLENDNIFILCPELIPSKYATQPWQLEQEMNLDYVARTRAKKELHYITDYSKIEAEITKLLKDE